MRISRAATLAVTTTVLTMLTGCGAGVGEDEVIGLGEDGTTELGTAEQAFSGVAAWGYGYSGSFQADLAPYTGNTTFLMGITGNLQGSAGATLGVVYPNWRGYLQSATGHWIGVGWGSVASVNGVTDMESYTNDSTTTTNGATLLGDSSSDGKVRCFLTGALNQHSFNQWAASTDEAFVFEAGNKWYLGGHGRVTAHARCLRVTTRLAGTSKTISYPSSEQTVDLGFDEPGKHCWLTGMGGRFRSEDLARGVRVYYEAGTLKWKMTVSANNYGRVECNK